MVLADMWQVSLITLALMFLKFFTTDFSACKYYCDPTRVNEALWGEYEFSYGVWKDQNYYHLHN